MKNYFTKHRFSILIFIAYIIVTGTSYFLNIQSGKDIFNSKFLPFLFQMLVFLPSIYILIGLADVWMSKEKVEKLIGEGSRLKGNLLIILMGIMQAGPLYAAFPVLSLLWKKGASSRNIFIYIGTFSTIKLPLLMLEITFLGWKFFIIRFIVTVPIIMLISLAMEKYVKNKDFKVNQV